MESVQTFLARIVQNASRVGARTLLVTALVVATVGRVGSAAASHDPNRTVTIYVHGFDRAGADRHGVYGIDVHESLADSLASMAGLAPANPQGGALPIQAVTATTYYGDTAPPYYSAQDRAEIDRLTATWGGGIPRYAFIVARYAQHALERSGADQVNLVSASLGSLVVRWMIEKNVSGLAGSGRIARWLTIEGVIAGNWAASRDELIQYLELVQPEPIDVEHMDHDWVSTHLHTPRREGDSPYYAGILIGETASTDDRGNQGLLTKAMLAYDEYEPNDGVQTVPDAVFQSLTPSSRFLGRMPTRSLFHSDHLGIQSHLGAYAQAATFITGRRRVTVTMTSARLLQAHEPQLPFWNWMPAEVVFESFVRSPAIATRWGITDPLSVHSKNDATAPLRRFTANGQTQATSELLFDDFVLPEETRLRIDLHALELDYDARYGVFETATTPYSDELGAGSIEVSTLAPGTYAFSASDWSCEISVSMFDYPFASVLDAPAPAPRIESRALVVAPNPSRTTVHVSMSASAGFAIGERATLEILDVSGRRVRVLQGDAREGFRWDGRDLDGRAAPPGVYLYRATTARGTWWGRACRMR